MKENTRVFYNSFSERFIPEEDFRARYEELCEEAAEQVAEFRKTHPDFKYTGISFEQYLADVLEEECICEVTKLVNSKYLEFTEEEILALLQGNEVEKAAERETFCYKLVEDECSEGHYNLHSCHIGKNWQDWEDCSQDPEFTEEEIQDMLQGKEVFREQEVLKYRLVATNDGEPELQVSYPEYSGYAWTAWEEEITFAAIWR